MKFFLIFFICSYNIFANADNNNWQINNDHSQIMFDIPYLGVSKVIGRFNKFQGNIIFDDQKKSIKKIDIIIEAHSINTANNLRDGHLKKKDFLDTRKYPLIFFNSIKITKVSSQEYRVQGDLKIKNIIKQHEIFITLLGNIKDSWNKDNILLSFKTKLDRKKYEITWNKTIDDGKFLLGENISIFGNLQFQKINNKTQSSKYLVPITRYTDLRNKLNIGAISREKFKEETKVLDDITVIKKLKNKIIPANKKKDSITIDESAVVKPPSRSFYWWFAFVSMGFFSFIGGVLGIITIKKMFSDKYQDAYEETGWWGYISDAYVLAFLFIYTWAQWYLGWGV